MKSATRTLCIFLFFINRMRQLYRSVFSTHKCILLLKNVRRLTDDLSKEETKRYLYLVRVAPDIIHSSTIDGNDAHGSRVGQGLGHCTILSALDQSLRARHNS